MALPRELFGQQQVQGGLLSPGMAGLLGLAGGLLSNSQQRMGPALGGGLLAGLGAMDAQERTNAFARRGQIEEQQLQAQMAERRRQMAEQEQARARQAQLRATLSPQEQQLFDLDAEGFSKALIDQRMPKPQGPSSGIAKINADLQAGLITPEQAQAAIRRETYIAPPAAPEPDRTLVEVYDANSPTGTSLVPRSQAVGKPGKPPTGLMSITGYDEAGRPLIDIGGRSGGKPPAGYRTTPDGNLEAIPGGPADKISAEAQGKASLLPGALEDLNAVRAMVVNPDGSINRGVLTTGAVNIPFTGGGGMPFTQGRDLNARILSTADTILRIRTGAAAPETEVARFAQAYQPSPLDSADTIKEKLDRLERDLKNASLEYNRGTSRDPSRAEPAEPAPAEPVKITGDADYEKLPSGAIYAGPDGKTRKKP